jgi:hypothetical protein
MFACHMNAKPAAVSRAGGMLTIHTCLYPSTCLPTCAPLP